MPRKPKEIKVEKSPSEQYKHPDTPARRITQGVAEVGDYDYEKLKDFKRLSTTPQTMYRVAEVAKKISEGGSRQNLYDWIISTYKVSQRQANAYYNAALRYLMPNDEDKQAYRDGLIQANLDRLDKIIDSSMNCKYPNYKMAKDCIAEMNRILVPKEGLKVGVQDGDKTIMIQFDV